MSVEPPSLRGQLHQVFVHCESDRPDGITISIDVEAFLRDWRHPSEVEEPGSATVRRRPVKPLSLLKAQVLSSYARGEVSLAEMSRRFEALEGRPHWSRDLLYLLLGRPS